MRSVTTELRNLTSKDYLSQEELDAVLQLSESDDGGSSAGADQTVADFLTPR